MSYELDEGKHRYQCDRCDRREDISTNYSRHGALRLIVDLGWMVSSGLRPVVWCHECNDIMEMIKINERRAKT